MAPTALKREHPEPVAWVGIRPIKMQRTTVIHNGVVPAPEHPVYQMNTLFSTQYQPMYGASVYFPGQSPPIDRGLLWETISTMDADVLRQRIFHATLGNMTFPQLTSRVLDAHSTRLRLKAEAIDNAQKAQEAKERRDRKKVFDFDSHYGQIDDWLSNDPIGRKACRTSYSIYEKVVARIEKITAKATEPTTNFQNQTQCYRYIDQDCGVHD
ncbi:hypothetical protein CLAFUW4_08813 [Fulvia fulva]|uniref:Uncharacterized protein n=1 Tax=Passalora fulva TaxID=5499 RepID=A0A9Q8PFI4_PASFU|nr:uncharacterized protein CLAFUR5_08920 [Fulvia fulva]KAK4613883.1 hypothetical protein CLAFUR4_08819 [Fulvia fulva]KAK4614604.1 hypothetical protein CLAFUR0_08811 [Fulvia fulva]UJO21546.1 hypothetical protein CLAFUR5_08920 [Fulvia fulva]WPV20415.1 hypothetical protein CLAFUW4_08813 [Fulvia fulva]WPV35350.1 hypothetical protein CLAFUW7_08814 [Fulvia fulva]